MPLRSADNVPSGSTNLLCSGRALMSLEVWYRDFSRQELQYAGKRLERSCLRASSAAKLPLRLATRFYTGCRFNISFAFARMLRELCAFAYVYRCRRGHLTIYLRDPPTAAREEQLGRLRLRIRALIGKNLICREKDDNCLAFMLPVREINPSA